jgi:phage FluMu protein gp41
MATPDLTPIEDLQRELNAHPVYAEVTDLADLRVFMAHHVYPVWDFMSLIKYLQRTVAPTTTPWLPQADPGVVYFINQLVLEEESDHYETAAGTEYSSHFALYLRAMTEIGADAAAPQRFLETVQRDGVDAALYADGTPLPARYFCETTFCFIREDKPHAAAAALAVGRERIIPDMFRRLLAANGVDATQAPTFHHYLNRHIHLDEDFHGPLSMRLMDNLCGNDPKRLEEAATAAEEAICARIRFWDGVLDAMRAARG